MHYTNRGKIQDFHLGGAKPIMCVHAHHKCETWSPLRPGFLMLSRAIWALFLSILIQNGIRKTNTVNQILGGGGGCTCCAPL